MDEKLTDLFMGWLKAFEAIQEVMSEADVMTSHRVLTEIETCMAATPAEGFHGLVVKLGLHQFLNDQADATNVQVDSAYSDLVRLSGHDPAGEILRRFDVRTA